MTYRKTGIGRLWTGAAFDDLCRPWSDEGMGRLWVGAAFNDVCRPWSGGLGQAQDELAAGRRDAQLANEAGIPVPVLRAIRMVESGSNPAVIRFEPHLFHRDTSNRFRSQIAYTPGATRAASDIRSETDRSAFDRAFALDPSVAVRSTSWGSYQVLGRHLLNIISDPRRAVDEFYRDPATMSDRVFISWMNASPVAKVAARSRNFEEFAHRYNGCALPCDRYAPRLRAAYQSALPEWNRIAPMIGIATPGDLPEWTIPVAFGGGIAAAVAATGFAGWAVYRHRRKSRRR